MSEIQIIGAGLEAVTQVNKYFLTPIMNQLNYLFCYKSNIQCLGAQVEELNQTRDSLQLEVDAAKRNADDIGRDVEEWFKKVAKINATKERIIQDGARVQQGCFYGCCPNIKVRYCLSREAKNETEAAMKLLKDAGSFRKISYTAKLEPIPTESAGVEFDSRKSKEEEIMKSLKDNEAYVIAVCGMGGVGKTNMVQKIEDRVREEKMFEAVAMATVSRPLDLHKVQQEIAERLGLKFDQHTLPARAERLHKRLKNDKSVLIILDDVWEKFNLQEIGIPSKSSHEACKVIMTSRLPGVCRKIEDSVKIIRLDVLPEPEAWNLFKEKAGEIIDKPDLHRIAVNVEKECKGLPLALVTVAAALRNSSVHSWEDALHQLKRSMAANIEGVYEEVYVPLKWSYDQLQSQEARYLFLLCCLFPEDYEIPLETLVRYGFGLCIFAGVENVAEARNRVHGLVEMLQDRFLLIGSILGSEAECTQYDCVKMHDVIRDMAISIASKEKHVFMVAHDKNLRGWPNRDSFEDYTCISLGSGCKITLPENINCSRLEMLCLSFVEGGVEIQESSLCGMRGLKVLIASGVQSLPSSLLLLTNLRSLFLERGKFLNLPDEIGEFVNLEILNLANSRISMLQKEMGRLKNLRVLDLTSCCNLENIAPGVISGFVQLEELFMLKSFEKWEVEGIERNNASLAEIATLTKLTTLQIRVPRQDSINLVEDTRNWHKLTRYNVEIGQKRNPRHYDYEVHITRRCMILYLGELVHLTHSIRVMLDNAEVIELEGAGSSEIANQLSRDGGQNVKILKLQSCENLGFLFDSASWNLPNTSFLPRATQLRIFFTHCLKEICRGQPPAGSFSNLTFIDLWLCDGLKNGFSFSIAAMLPNLERVEVWACHSIENVFFEQDGQCVSNTTKNMAFPKLSEIHLGALPLLCAFCKPVDTTVFEFPQLYKMRLFHCPMLKSFCALPEGDQNAEQQFLLDQKVIMCSGLKKLELEHLDFKTGIFDPRIPIGYFFGLETLILKECSCENLLSKSLCSEVPNLKTLEVESCQMLEEVIAKDVKEEETNSEVTLFPQLKELKLRKLPKILQFCHTNCGVELPSLEVLSISECPLMETFSRSSATSESDTGIRSFFDGATFSRIKKLWLDGLNVPTKLFGDSIPVGNFSTLESLAIDHLDKLQSVFSPRSIRELLNLQALDLSYCPVLEEMILEQAKEDETNLLPQLKTLVLKELPKLVRFCHINNDVKLPSLESIKIFSCERLESVSPLLSRSLLNLQSLEISYCPILEEVIPEQAKEDETNLLPQLKTLELNDLPKLVRFCHINNDVKLPSLQSITISGCERLKSVCPPLSRGLLNLQSLRLYRCPLLEEVIPEEQKKDETNERETLFPQLERLVLSRLPKLIRFCNIKHDVKLPLLKKVTIRECPMLETFSSGSVYLPNTARIWGQAGYFVMEQD